MDSPLLYIAVIIGVLVLAVLVPRWVRRSSGSAGEREARRLGDAGTAAARETLGTTLVVLAPPSVVREIADSVALQHPRAFTILPGGTYGIRFVEPEDAVARLIEIDEGTRVEVARFRDYAGMPNSWAFWTEFQDRVRSGAHARDLETVAGPLLAFERGSRTDVIWSAVGADER